jgi:hypothetical protein
MYIYIYIYIYIYVLSLCMLADFESSLPALVFYVCMYVCTHA